MRGQRNRDALVGAEQPEQGTSRSPPSRRRAWLSVELDGSFEELDFSSLATSGKPVAIPVRLPRSVPILLGATSQGQLISLVDCQFLSGSPSFLHQRGSLKVWPEVLVYGVHFASSDDFRLTSLSIPLFTFGHMGCNIGIQREP